MTLSKNGETPVEKNGSGQVSVVIPTYNRAGFLCEAIDSALAQTGVDLEVIVVDDGSTDDTESVMSAYDDPRIRYIRQENAGAAVARNTGIFAASKPWVALLDSDDVWLPGKLAGQFDDLAKHPDVIAHMTNVDINRPGMPKTDLVRHRRIEALFPAGKTRRFDAPLIFNVRHNFMRLQSLLVRTDVLHKIGGFDQTTTYFEDTELANRIALEGPWLVSPEVTVREIRRDEAGIGIGTRRSKELEVGYESLSSKLVSIKERSLSKEELTVVQEKIDLYAGLAAREWLRKGKVAEARAALAPARVVRPLLRLALMPGLGSLIRPLLRRNLPWT